jgi:hypothetical protein
MAEKEREAKSLGCCCLFCWRSLTKIAIENYLNIFLNKKFGSASYRQSKRTE